VLIGKECCRTRQEKVRIDYRKKGYDSAKSTQTVHRSGRDVIQLFRISKFHYVRMVVLALVIPNMRVHISRFRYVECVGGIPVQHTNELIVRFVNCMYGAENFRSKPSERMWQNVCCFSILSNKTLKETLKTYGNVSNWK